jgi:hypothetical protein
MKTQPTTVEVKIAKLIHDNLPEAVIKASTHPLFCKLNLHNSSLLKKINQRASTLYKMSCQRDELVKAPYNYGGEDNLENALLAIQEIIKGDHDHREYLFERIGFLASEAINTYYEKNHTEWLTRIQTAIHNAKTTKKPVVIKSPKKTVKSVKNVKTVVSKTKKPIGRPRNRKGQFIKIKPSKR